MGMKVLLVEGGGFVIILKNNPGFQGKNVNLLRIADFGVAFWHDKFDRRMIY